MRFSINEYIYEVNKNTSSIEIQNKNSKKFSYKEVLSRVQDLISNNNSKELAEIIYTDEGEKRLKVLILQYVNQYRFTVDQKSNIADLVDDIYNDMAGLGILTKYIKDPNVEEININGPMSIIIQYKDKTEKIPETFFSPTECIDIVKKMARIGNIILDGSTPLGDSYIAKGIRMSGAIYPCVPENIGAIASIRKQMPSIITRENLINWGTASPEELDFLTMCLNHGISIGVAGATSAGKTSDMDFLLKQIQGRRILTIEDTSELNPTEYDENGIVSNDVVQLLTKEKLPQVSMLDLLRLSLRLHPEILSPAEMRGEEALTAQEAGRTGHTIITSLHANGSSHAYDRILTMCLMSDTRLSEERLLKSIIDAFPIMVFKKRLADKSRRYMEIFEATGVDNGEVKGNILFKYIINDYIRDKDNNIIKVDGEHKKIANISSKLAGILFENGVEIDTIRKYAGDSFIPFQFQENNKGIG